MEFHYTCSECEKDYALDPYLMICPDCAKSQQLTEPLRGVLDVTCDGSLAPSCNILSLLPVEAAHLPDAPVGNTALWQPARLRQHFGIKKLFIKDDGGNPTGSLKDRASFLVAGMARAHGIQEIALASTGNAGASMAGIGANCGLKITLFLPEDAPKAKMVQALQYGARLVLVAGNYDLAFDWSLEYSRAKKGVLSRNTAYNPLTIEGKKTVAIEIFQQLGHAPDNIFVACGDGVILSGVYKGFADMKKMGWISFIPKIYAVQAQGSDAICRAFKSGAFDPRPTTTLADSISVSIPRNGYHALKNLKRHGGEPISVSDQEILFAQHELSRWTGLFTEPAAAAAMAGFLKLTDQIKKDETTVIIATGNGLKDPAGALAGVKPPPEATRSLNGIL